MEPASAAPGRESPLGISDATRNAINLAIAAMVLLAVAGTHGLSRSAPRRLVAATSVARQATASATSSGSIGAAAAGAGLGAAQHSRESGEDFGAENDSYTSMGVGPGDRSITWRSPGRERVDALSLALPLWLAPRTPLGGRLVLDANYLRAMFGSLWLLVPAIGAALGVAAAVDTGGRAVPPSLWLASAILVLACLDALAGAAALLAFALGVALSGGFAGQEPSPLHALLLMLAFLVLWVAVPLLGAATRPFRRNREPQAVYGWDRVADGTIAALLCGWIVHKMVPVLDQFVGFPVALSGHAGLLAALTIAAIATRVAAEEVAAAMYPLRLAVVELSRPLPHSHPLQQAFGALIRAAIFTVIGYAFIGSCWQLWVGGGLFLAPELLAIFEERYPNSVGLRRALPRGLIAILVMLIVGTVIATLLADRIDDELALLRGAFVVLSIPGVLLATMSLFGRKGPSPIWSWPRQLSGAVVVGVIVVLALRGWG